MVKIVNLSDFINKVLCKLSQVGELPGCPLVKQELLTLNKASGQLDPLVQSRRSNDTSLPINMIQVLNWAQSHAQANPLPLLALQGLFPLHFSELSKLVWLNGKPHSGEIMSSPYCQWGTKKSKNCFQSCWGSPQIPARKYQIHYLYWLVNSE